MRTRPDHLPDFTAPPLNEVVLGVQFEPIRGYSGSKAAHIWKLFKDEFPVVQEHPPLSPVIETFGDAVPHPSDHRRLSAAPSRRLLWFFSQNHDYLIQLQEDRFFLNWHEGGDSRDYPRFEKVAESFEKHFQTLDSFVKKDLGTGLELIQAEVSCTNLILLKDYNEAANWLNFVDAKRLDLESIDMFFSEVVQGTSSLPLARLSYELTSMMEVEGEDKALQFALMFRGKPLEANISSAMDLIHDGRDKIVTKFGELTTKSAHRHWGRKKWTRLPTSLPLFFNKGG